MATRIQRFKSWILAGGIAATTVTGALYGASLKSHSQIEKESERSRQASSTEIIAALEERRKSLMMKISAIEKKLEEIAKRSATVDKTQEKGSWR